MPNKTVDTGVPYTQEEIMVSACCLTYNHEEYIEDALKGFVNQKTNFRYEVIVHDDASTDRTAEIVKRYSEKYPDIIKPIFQKENQWSKGIKVDKIVKPYLTGKYVAICEGDDCWISNHKLQLQVDFLETHPDYVACAHNSTVMHIQNGIIELRNNAEEEYDCNVEECFDRLISGLREAWQLSGLMYKRECADLAPDFFSKPTTFGDLSLDLSLLVQGRVRFFPEPMSLYRMGTKTSRMRQRDESHKKMAAEIIELLQDFDVYTSYVYTDKIHTLLLCQLYEKYFQEKNYKKLVKGELETVFREKPLFQRFMVRLFILFPSLSLFAQRVHSFINFLQERNSVF